MKIFILTVLFYAVFANSSGQRMSPEVYWIQLKDKNGTNFSTDRPEAFLSPDAVERRIKANIPVTEMDLPVSGIYTDSLLRLGVKIIGTSKWMNSVLIQNPDSLLLDAISTLSFVSEFDTAYSDFTAGGIQGTIINLPSEAENVESFFYGVASRQISLLGGNFLHNYGYDGEDIKIAVLDAGFYRVNEFSAFQSLWQENRILATRDFVNPGSDIFNQHPHGLSVLSTMAAFIP
ncbi:MAG: serine protease, partial [Bacteroidales bacterium]|nr:serine protease [Bacteroidales bacterium]